MPDKELVEKARRGDQSAFEQLVLDNQNRVYSLALRLCGNREEAADLSQEAFVKAWQGLSAFQGESSFATWVYRLTTNVCIDHLRRKSAGRRWSRRSLWTMKTVAGPSQPTGPATRSCCWRNRRGGGRWPGDWNSFRTGSGESWC